MSVSSVPQKPTPVASVDYGRHEDEDRGYGWIMFAGVLLLLGIIEGIAAIGNTNFFVHKTHYVFANLNSWGWVVMCIGVLPWVVGCAVYLKNQFLEGDRRGRPARKRGGAAADDADVPVLVAVNLRTRRPRDLRPDRLRQKD
jgi:hypothetical protein